MSILCQSIIQEIADRSVLADVEGTRLTDFQDKVLVRLVAKGKKFTNVSFLHSTLKDCYLRGCVFDSCDFTGCRFVGTNLYGSTFSGCNFDYSTFERTLITDEILENGCPSRENLKLKFARSLRMNFQQLGDSRAANKAIRVELAATSVHLFKAWQSNDFYYRKKYRGKMRFEAFLQWLNFKVLDWVWGNGESIVKLFRTFLLFLGLIAVYNVLTVENPTRLPNYWNSLLVAPQIFFGVVSPREYPGSILSLIIFVKLVLMGFFLSIIIKRMNRR